MICRPIRRALCALFAVSLSFAAFLAQSPASCQLLPVYKNPKAAIEDRVNDLMSRLTQDEKVSLLTGTGMSTNPIARLGVPAMQMADAGEGVRGGGPGTTGPATLFPAEVAMASTWDTNLVGRIGKAIGEEALNKGPGINVMLGPAVNIHRSPLCGRNGEYFTEDPYLNSRLAVNYVVGEQGTGCGSCIKHYCCNNEEVDRGFVIVRVDERTLREIYLPAFEAAAKEAHVRSVMAAYNKINGPHATANHYLLTDVLKKCWGWDGLVMSDWGAVHETSGVINSGNDLEMPGPGFLQADRVDKALSEGLVTQDTIDANVRRILRAVIRSGIVDGHPHVPDPAVVNSPEHQKLTYEAASKGIVLLKNENNILPLNASKLHSIAVIGPSAIDMQFGAAGSVGLQPFYHIDPLDAITKRAGPNVKINYAEGRIDATTMPETAFTTPDGTPGLKAEYYNSIDLSGKPTLVRTDPKIDFNWLGAPVEGIGHDDFSVRWTGKLKAPTTGSYVFVMTADDGCRVIIDGKEIISHWQDSAALPTTGLTNLVAGQTYDLRVEYYQHAGDASANLAWTVPGAHKFDDAIAAASRSDIAIVCVNTMHQESEGRDRASMNLPGDQDQLIQAVSAVNKNTIVVLNNGAPVTLVPWLSGVSGLIESWFPGQEGGHAVASILFGDVNPSAKLPDTFAVKREDYPDYGNFPGTKGIVHYAEGIYVGYRHFDKNKIEPVYPFGYGLSYTTFRYNNLRLTTPALSPGGQVSAKVDITNAGAREGAEVVELYVSDTAPKIDKPIRELKGFDKIDLAPGQTKTVTLTLTGRSLAYCDVPDKCWKADHGVYNIEVGASSRDIRQTIPLTLTADFTEPIPYMADVNTFVPPTDLAKGRPSTASSTQRDDTPPSAAFDGDDTSRWSSAFSDPQWLSVDMGAPTMINGARLLWEAAFARSYKLQVSLDGSTWTDVYSMDKGAGGEEIIKLAPVNARYVRMYGMTRGTQFGYSIYSFEVYGAAQTKTEK